MQVEGDYAFSGQTPIQTLGTMPLLACWHRLPLTYALSSTLPLPLPSPHQLPPLL